VAAPADVLADIPAAAAAGTWPFVTAFGHDPQLWPLLTAALARFDRPVTCWSAGCQIGTETYTLAMHVHAAELDHVRIVASDALAVRQDIAYTARYLRSEVEGDVAMGRLAPDMYARYFRSDAPDHVQVVDEVRQLVEFLPPAYVPDRVARADVVLLRNIWVHLDPAERWRLVRKLARYLPGDGLVVFRHFFADEVASVMPPGAHTRASSAARLGEYAHGGKRGGQRRPTKLGPHAVHPDAESRPGCPRAALTCECSGARVVLRVDAVVVDPRQLLADGQERLNLDHLQLLIDGQPICFELHFVQFVDGVVPEVHAVPSTPDRQLPLRVLSMHGVRTVVVGDHYCSSM